MSTIALHAKHEAPFEISPITYPVDKAELQKLSAEYLELIVTSVDDKQGIAEVREARLKFKDARVAVERRRKELKASALEYGRLVDSEAKAITAIIEPVEDHLAYQEGIVKREQERMEREAAEKRQAKTRERFKLLADCGASYLPEEFADLSDEDFAQLLAAERADKAKRDEQAAAEKAERDRIAAEQQAEADRLAKERAELDRQRIDAEARTKRMAARLTLLARAGAVHNYTDDELADMTPEYWQSLHDNAMAVKAEKDRAAAEEFAMLARQRAEQAEAQAKIDAENKRIADEKAAKRQSMIVSRLAQLHVLAIPGEALADEADVADLGAIEWEQTLRACRGLKAEYDRQEQEREAAEAKAKADADEAERKRIEALRPDHEKLLAFITVLQSLELPAFSQKWIATKSARAIEQACETLREIAGELSGGK